MGALRSTVTAGRPPTSNPPPAQLLRADVRRLMEARDWAAALQRLGGERLLVEADPQLRISQSQCLLALGRLPEACAAADAARRRAPRDAVMFDAIGNLLSQGGDQTRALEAFDQAVALAPANAHFLFNRATVQRFLGRLGEAERDYDRVIGLRPQDYEAYKNRSELRTQRAAANHVAELERLLAQGIADWRGRVQIRYALAKEYEDLGDYDISFEHLRQGAGTRRQHLRYEVATDVATVGWIVEMFPAALLVQAGAGRGDAPIFIVGLPRSGTTLVDRILGSHSAVHSAGELDHFARCIVEGVRRSHGAPLPRRELVARSARLDFGALGAEYLRRTRDATGVQSRFTDKMPLNYLYCGLIHLALPEAKIVHVTRHPMAACHAMYKTLFKDAYPFSYDLEEIGAYYASYRCLMQHWQASMPGVIHELRYEALVADQVGETRKLLEYCGLEWEEACVDFHRNASPTTTASAVQVRQPLYRSSVSQWRQYEKQLEPLAKRLQACGIDTEPA